MVDVPNQSTLTFFEIFGVFLGLSGCILFKVTREQDGPYMDEIFHVRQCQKYCEGQFDEWDPKITTLPGLYLMTSSVMQTVSWFFGYPMKTLCSIFMLRSVNVVMATGNFCVLFALLSKLHKDKTVSSAWLLMTSVTLALMPVLYFFTFLYYTDTGSTFFVLTMYLMHLHGNSKLAALVGIAAILFRQTNIIWVIFVAGLLVVDRVNEYIHPKKRDLTEQDTQSFKYIQIILHRIFSDLKYKPRLFGQLILNIFKDAWCYIGIGILFVLFVIINGGIVVGDRSNHEACLHVTQIFYFACMTYGFAVSHLFSFHHIKSFLQDCVRHPFALLLCICLCVLFVKYFTYEHPFLLADNRHYTFYIWARLYKRHWSVKYALIPIYLITIHSLAFHLKHKGILWNIIFTVCLCAASIPQKLLEFRYFIIPYLIVRLNLQPSPNLIKIVIELCIYAGVNAATLYLFLYKPFTWQNVAETQRFMW